MQAFTDNRSQSSEDQIWFLQHPAVFTQGTSCYEPVSDMHRDIPVIHSDRGGQMTYHGPGQLVVYFLLDIKRLGIGPKSLVQTIETLCIECLRDYGIQGERLKGAPGIYVDGKKIAAMGFRIRKGCCYHGLSLNVNMDLSPFESIVTCGRADMEVTQVSNYRKDIPIQQVQHGFRSRLIRHFNLLTGQN